MCEFGGGTKKINIKQRGLFNIIQRGEREGGIYTGFMFFKAQQEFLNGVVLKTRVFGFHQRGASII